MFKSLLGGLGKVAKGAAKSLLPGWAGTAIDLAEDIVPRLAGGGARPMPTGGPDLQRKTAPPRPGGHTGSRPGFDLGDIGHYLGKGADAAGLRKPGGGIDFQNLLKGGALAGGAYAAYKGSKEAGKNESRRNDMLDESRNIARGQAELSEQLLQEAAPIRQASNAAIQRRLDAGPRAMPNLAGLADTANPFRKKFPGGVPPMMGGR